MTQLLDGLLWELVKSFGYNSVVDHLAALRLAAPLEGQEKAEIEAIARLDGGRFSKIEAIKEIRGRYGFSLLEAKAVMEATWPETAIAFRNIR